MEKCAERRDHIGTATNGYIIFYILVNQYVFRSVTCHKTVTKADHRFPIKQDDVHNPKIFSLMSQGSKEAGKYYCDDNLFYHLIC